jgi:hypothetical protein
VQVQNICGTGAMEDSKHMQNNKKILICYLKVTEGV